MKKSTKVIPSLVKLITKVSAAHKAAFSLPDSSFDDVTLKPQTATYATVKANATPYEPEAGK